MRHDSSNTEASGLHLRCNLYAEAFDYADTEMIFFIGLLMEHKHSAVRDGLVMYSQKILRGAARSGAIRYVLAWQHRSSS